MGDKHAELLELLDRRDAELRVWARERGIALSSEPRPANPSGEPLWAAAYRRGVFEGDEKIARGEPRGVGAIQVQPPPRWDRPREGEE